MDFNNDSIDFVRTYDNFRKKYKPTAACRKRFGVPVALMANSVITANIDKDSLKGIKKCLEYEISIIELKHCLWMLPLYKRKLFSNHPYGGEQEKIALLADSMILTVVGYRHQLNEKHSGLATLTLHDIIYGFEWVCHWINTGIKITPNENELIATFDIDYLKQFIK